MDGLKVTLFGIRALPATTEYEELTSAYFTKVYNDNSVENTFMIDVKVTDETSVGETRKERRRLGSTSTISNEEVERELQTVAVELTYTQTMWYNSDDPSFDPEDTNLTTVPLSKTSYRLEYVDTLKSKSVQGYDELYDVSSITRGDSDLLESGDGSTKKGLGLGAIIGIVVGSALLLFLLVAGSLNSNNQKKNKVSMVEDSNGEKAMNDQPLTTKEMEMMHAEQEQPKSFLEEKFIATVDYDYGSATLGSETRQASVIDTSFDEMGEYKNCHLLD